MTEIAADLNLERCDRCGELVRWARLPSGIPVPMDPEPNVHGALAVTRARWGLAARLVTPARPRQPYEAPYLPHLATCSRSPIRHPAAPPMPRQR